MKILYVQDNAYDALLTQSWLLKHSSQIVIETVAAQSEAEARLNGPGLPPYDLVLTDLRLRDGDGLSLLKYIRERRLPLGVVVMTGTGDEEAAVAALRAGADDYVAKRRDYLKRLPSTLESALHHHRAQTARHARHLKVLYAEYRDTDIDLTLRHLQQYAPHIQLDIVRTGTELLLRLPLPGQPGVCDAILLGLPLDGLNVMELLEGSRRDGAFETPLVLVTVQEEEELALRALKLGASSYLVKKSGYLYQLPGELENACYRAELNHERAALSASEARNRAMLEAIPDLMFLQDRHGVYLDYHARNPNDLLVPPEQFLGKNMREVLPAELVERFAKSFENVVQTGQTALVEYSVPIFGEERHYEARVVHCDHDKVLSVMRDITERKLAEQRLRESEERFRQLAENIGAVFFITEEINETSPGRVVYISPAYEKIWGRPRESVYRNTRSWLDAVHPEDRSRVSAALHRGVQEQFDEEFRVVRPDGEIRWVHDRVFHIRDESGEVYRLVGIVEDITRQKQIEDALRESQLRYNLATTAGGVGVWDWNLGTGEIYIDPMLKTVLGFEDHEIENRIDDWGKRVHPEDADRVMAEAQAHIDGQTAYYEVEHRMLHKDGSVRCFLARGALVEGENGNPRRMVGTDTDITERKKAEEALRESENRARRTLVEQMLAGVVECDADGKFVLVNQRFCDIVGYTEAELLQMRSDNITGHDDLPRITALYRRLVETGETFIVEMRYRRKDGAEVWVNSNVSPIRNGQGEIVASVAIVIDVTDRKRAELEREELLKQEKAARAAAQAANRSKDEFLAVVSHELRSPLNAILGYARLLRTRAADAAEIQKTAEIIERNGRSQLQLIEDLLDTARIISGKLKLEVQPVELAGVITGALDVMRPAAQAKGIELRAELNLLSGRITGDPNRLQQIVWNLLSNAIKFTPRSGRVDLRSESAGHHVIITIKDTGKGIEPEFLPFVFDRFRQSDSSSARRFGGLGLGLSLVKQLVELHGGTIEVASDGPGCGATFTVTLPQHATQAETFVPDRPRAVASHELMTDDPIQLDQVPSLAGVSVLVVDDDEEARSLLMATLGEHGAQVIAVASGVEARAILADPPGGQRPDVLILDINMPGEDGYQTLQRVRALETELGIAASQQIPAVALTALGRTEDRLKALVAGFRMHVVKPVESTELAVVIASLVERRSVARGAGF